MTEQRESQMDKTIAAAYARIKLGWARIAALDFAVEGLRDGWASARSQDPAQAQHMVLYLALYRNLNDAYRDLFMWGLLRPETRAEAAEIALERFLQTKRGTNMEVMRYLSEDGQSPGRWDGQVEAQLRAEIENARKAIKAERRAPKPGRRAKS